MDREAIVTILNKINCHINDTEKTILGLQGILVGLHKAKDEVVATLKSVESNEKTKEEKGKATCHKQKLS